MPNADNDSPWEEMLEQELPVALAFFFPKVHADLDWGRDYESLDQELRKLDPGGATGKRIVDRLVKAWTTDGDVRYLHIEVQGARESGFAKRMYDYNSRSEQHFGQPVASFAILIDTHPRWRPRKYETEVYGTIHRFGFVPVKILRWEGEGREDELRADENPVAMFVLAQLAAMRSKKDDDRISEAITRKEKENTVPYVTYFERRGIEKGLLEGKKESIAAVLEVRFPQEVQALIPIVKQASEMAELERLLQVVKTASLEEVRSALQQGSAS